MPENILIFDDKKHEIFRLINDSFSREMQFSEDRVSHHSRSELKHTRWKTLLARISCITLADHPEKRRTDRKRKIPKTNGTEIYNAVSGRLSPLAITN